MSKLQPVDEVVGLAQELWAEALEEYGGTQTMFILFNKEAKHILTAYKLTQQWYKQHGIELPDFLPGITVTVKDAEDDE